MDFFLNEDRPQFCSDILPPPLKKKIVGYKVINYKNMQILWNISIRSCFLFFDVIWLVQSSLCHKSSRKIPNNEKCLSFPMKFYMAIE